MKVLLTSAGLNTESLKHYFLGLLPKKPEETKALFIPPAALDPQALALLPRCMTDLLKCGIRGERIDIYNLQRELSAEELMEYDVVYLCGGDTDYLLKRFGEQGFGEALKKYIAADKILISVNAGSMLEAQNLRNNLGLPHCRLYVLRDRQAS